MSQEFEYFYEDEVCRITKKGQLRFGMVLENAELVSSDEESEIDEEDRVTKGNIRVAWYPNGDEAVVSERKVHLADRSLMPGDVVRRLIKGRDTQRGYCRHVTVVANVQIVSEGQYIVLCVDSSKLTPLEAYAHDMAVALDSWVGLINMIKCRLLLNFKDGSSCYLKYNAALELKDIKDPRDKDCEFRRTDFYPGQCLEGSVDQFEEAEWICKKAAVSAKLEATERAKHLTKLRATVLKVEVQMLGVRWLCQSFSPAVAGAADTTPPKYIVSGPALSRVRILNVFEPCTLQIGDRNYYTVSESDVFVSKKYFEVVMSSFKEISDFKKILNIDPKEPLTSVLTTLLQKFSFNIQAKQPSLVTPENEPAKLVVEAQNIIQSGTDCDNIAKGCSTLETKETAHRNDIKSSSDAGEYFKSSSSSSVVFHTNSNSEALAKTDVIDGADSDSNYENIEDIDTGDLYDDDTASVSSGGTSTSSLDSSICVSKRHGGGSLVARLFKHRPSSRRVHRRLRPGPHEILKSRHRPPKPEDTVVVETLMTTSFADVVWQDGSIERGVPSSQLYPIHHLDDQEFFPGDFVLEQRAPASGSGAEESGVDPHDYGVVQRVDHAGRTAVVKWFRTYTAGAQPQPLLKGEGEVSVYDLRDHPDFRYRPGSVVIRVANFENDQNNSTGQVLDNCPSGQVLVWWADGRRSFCFPQDLYKVGEYDSDDGELWEDGADDGTYSLSGGGDASDDEDDGSWQTESVDEEQRDSDEDVVASVQIIKTEASDSEEQRTSSKRCKRCERQLCECSASKGNDGCQWLKTRLIANIEKARIAMSRLEEIFTQNPALQSTQVMRQLLDCYKECRYMDKLMSTRFFHESNFAGLIEKVRERGRVSTNQKISEQVKRLFQSTVGDDSCDPVGGVPDKRRTLNTSNSLTVNCCPCVDPSSDESFVSCQEEWHSDNEEICDKNRSCNSCSNNIASSSTDFNKTTADAEVEKPQARGSRSSKATEVIPGDCTMGEDSESSSLGPSGESICAVLCSMMKAQLLKTYDEVVSRYGGHFDMSNMNAESQTDLNGDAVSSDEEVITRLSDAILSNVFRGSASDAQSSCSEASVRLDMEATTQANSDSRSVTPADSAPPADSPKEEESGSFMVLESAPDTHKFKLTMLQPNNPAHFYKTVKNEMRLLQSSLPSGIWVRGYQDRMDLLSVMIRGPSKTPYEDGLFLFDIQLPAEYPHAPPLCNYIPYCQDRLNPNLYEDGKVCISLLGTWTGKGTEMWTHKSNLLQVLVSIQGLILVSEPYFNEAGYERQKGSQQGHENSRMYNEMALLKLIQSSIRLLQQPPMVFKDEIVEHFSAHAASFLIRLERWLEVSERHNNAHPLSPTTPNTFRSIVTDTDEQALLPEFPLIPASKGFCLTLRNTLPTIRSVLEKSLPCWQVTGSSTSKDFSNFFTMVKFEKNSEESLSPASDSLKSKSFPGRSGSSLGENSNDSGCVSRGTTDQSPGAGSVDEGCSAAVCDQFTQGSMLRTYDSNKHDSLSLVDSSKKLYPVHHAS